MVWNARSECALGNCRLLLGYMVLGPGGGVVSHEGAVQRFTVGGVRTHGDAQGGVQDGSIDAAACPVPRQVAEHRQRAQRPRLSRPAAYSPEVVVGEARGVGQVLQADSECAHAACFGPALCKVQDHAVQLAQVCCTDAVKSVEGVQHRLRKGRNAPRTGVNTVRVRASGTSWCSPSTVIAWQDTRPRQGGFTRAPETRRGIKGRAATHVLTYAQLLSRLAGGSHHRRRILLL